MLQWVARDSSKPRVKYGLSPGSYPYTALARTSTFARDDLCGAPASTVRGRSLNELGLAQAITLYVRGWGRASCQQSH